MTGAWCFVKLKRYQLMMSKNNHAALMKVFFFFNDNYLVWGEIEKLRGRQVKYNRICPCGANDLWCSTLKKKLHNGNYLRNKTFTLDIVWLHAAFANFSGATLKSKARSKAVPSPSLILYWTSWSLTRSKQGSLLHCVSLHLNAPDWMMGVSAGMEITNQDDSLPAQF